MTGKGTAKKHTPKQLATCLLAVIIAFTAVFAPAQEAYASQAAQGAGIRQEAKAAAKTGTKKKITLNKTKGTLYAGEYTTIKVKKVTGLSSKKVTYKSSNTKVATVSKKGVVTAKKKGTATVKVVSAADKKVKATFKLTVKAKAKKSSITLTKKKATLAVGGSTRIRVKKITGVSSRKVTYKSSNKKVAAVSSKGTVKAKGKGVATITVTSAVNKKVKAKFKVTVTQPVTDIAAPSEVVLQLSEGMRLSNITVYPINANNKEYTVTSKNPAVAGITKDPVGYGILGTGIGKTTVIVQSADKKVTKKIKVTVKKKIVKAEGISFKDSGTDYPYFELPKGESYQIQAYVYPKNATCKKMFWTSSDTSIATVDQNGIITHISPGRCDITVSTCDGTGTTQKYASHDIHITASEDPVMKWKDAVREMQAHPEKEEMYFYMTEDDYKTLYEYVREHGDEETLEKMTITNWDWETRDTCGFDGMRTHREEGKLYIWCFEIPEDFE